MTATQDGMIAELQRVNAELRQERDAALTRRDNDYDERIEHQSATIDVLKAMSASPGDAQPALDLIARRALELCNANGAAVYSFDGSSIDLLAVDFCPEPEDDLRSFRSQFPMPAARHMTMGRAILERRIDHLRGLEGEPEPSSSMRALGVKSLLNLPLFRDDRVIGVIGIISLEAGGFTDSQIELLKTFAEQAVIAIGSAETYRALQERTAELQESVERQSATIDVLRVMSSSTSDTQPVFDIIVYRAMNLCGCMFGGLHEFDGELMHIRALRGFSLDVAEAYARQYPMIPSPTSLSARAILDRRIVHIRDFPAEPDVWRAGRDLGVKSLLAVPLLREGSAVGVLALGHPHVGGFTDAHVELIKTFAEQAVIAIVSTATFRALQTRTNDLQESLEYQTATSEVLKVISGSTFDLQPVLDTVAKTAALLCDAEQALIATREGDLIRMAANFGFPPQIWALWMELGPQPLTAFPSGVGPRTIVESRIIHIQDVAAVSDYPEENITLGKQRTTLGVPLLREGVAVGAIVLARQHVEPFTNRQIELVSTFADQAVIAIENTRLMTEQREALEQQTATAEVLQVINASPGSLMPVFDAILEKAARQCEAAFGGLFTFEGDRIKADAVLGLPAAYAERWANNPDAGRLRPGTSQRDIFDGANVLHIIDLKAEESYQNGDPDRRALVDLGGARTLLCVSLRKETTLLGMISLYRQEVRPFSVKQLNLLQSFAAQAVIAVENARLLNELRARTDELAQRQAELRVTFENMGDGVAMFDEASRLVAWNAKFQEFFNVPGGLLDEHRTYAEYIRYLAERGDYGPSADVEDTIRQITGMTHVHRTYERVRPSGRVIEVRNNPVTGGGFVLMFSDITERKRSEAEIRAARDAAEESSRTIEAAFRELKIAQANLIQAEKMASLGQLTAGIAHEIKNPLNFVNNFAELSVDLLAELKDAIAPAEAALTSDQRNEVDDVLATLTGNLKRITEHGRRADGIVKAMLEHSRGASGERRTVNITALVDEALNLAYHGARAQDQSFNITLERDFSDDIAPIEVNPQDITRVLLNLFSNGFYAASKRARDGADNDFEPTLKVTTRAFGDNVEIRVRDNGTGIPEDIKDKLFQPFFTTKPTGEGTGLGLSITYDIVTKAHGGTISVASEVNQFTEFVVTLPRMMFTSEKSSA